MGSNHMSNHVTLVQIRNCLCRVAEIMTEERGDMKRDERMKLVEQYGGFRVVRIDGNGHPHYYSGDGTWDEEKATRFAGKLEQSLKVVFGHIDVVRVEHQDPKTGEWRRW